MPKQPPEKYEALRRRLRGAPAWVFAPRKGGRLPDAAWGLPALAAEFGCNRNTIVRYKRAEAARRAKVYTAKATGNNERYTPPAVIEAARATMGGIDLDPASCEVAQRTVRAGTYFTAEDDGLAQAWWGKVWMNPPFERGLIQRFVSKVLHEPVEQAIVLVHNATETQWARQLQDGADVMCLITGRLRFLDAEGNIPAGSPLQGQVCYGIRLSCYLNGAHLPNAP